MTLAIGMFIAGYYVGAGVAAWQVQKHFERMNKAIGRKGK